MTVEMLAAVESEQASVEELATANLVSTLVKQTLVVLLVVLLATMSAILLTAEGLAMKLAAHTLEGES